MTPEYLVTGATGFIGGRLVKTLVRQDLKVRALVRPNSDVTALRKLGVPFARCDLMKDDMSAYMSPSTRLVHIAGPGLSDLVSGKETASENISNLVAAAHKVDIAKFVYLSSIKARPPGFHNKSGGEYKLDIYGSKKRMEETILQDSLKSVPWTIIRAPATYGHPDRKSWEIFRVTQKRIVPILPSGSAAKFTIIHVDDLARTLRLATQPKILDNTIFEAGNAPALSWNDLTAILWQSGSLTVVCPPSLLRFGLSCVRWFIGWHSHGVSLINDRLDDLTIYEWIATNDFATPAAFVPRISLEDGLRAECRKYGVGTSDDKREQAV